ncbi:ComEC/Rec2 family competence protein [Candidatus Saccharibacteria bacterium]|nr:ComEC/Rec2 family competence protein [Candidatus Saccharibacteria bacterium]
MKNLWVKTIHQSWFVVAMCVGIIAGAVLAMVFRINYFWSPVWILLAVVLLIVSSLKPKISFVVLAFLAGMILIFFRAADTLKNGETAAETSQNFVIDVRDWFAERINSLIPEPENKLGKSYLLGMKSGLPKDLSENLRTVGLTHIVVASGAHLSILVGIARKIFGKISRSMGFLFSVLFNLFFMEMVGWTPSIMRAGIMSILTLITWYVGRKIAPLRMIVMVAALTLMINPGFLNNLGWILSFASYAGIMELGPRLTKMFYGNKKPGMIAETVITTVAATLMTLPVTLYYFGMVSLISVIANILILPTLPYAMGLVFLTGVVAGLPGVEMILAWLAKTLLDFHIYVVEFFGSMREFLVEIPPYQPWIFLIYVLILIPLVYSWQKRYRIKKHVLQ